ncbi:MerR family transcriptional regulator [Oceanirhabdus seepicola]|uniref:MerR family transcriptional regulator n=1 Tax=Oceanirhabdus seepicola TaxID=2828781 RepID=A0A9J6P3M5_9CLOT|nr:MerR family transcriptional regulator [Oceanirhabdus seepicola]MCM1991271.1 MerR family transcriptional regulator [Oceanirhabdus seepicola]
MNKLSIGQMSKLNGVSKQTLRMYDRIDLLKPMYVDKNSGYRFYDIKQSARIDIIQYMKSLGMQLKEIKLSLDKKSVTTIEEILMQQSEQIDKQIIELNYRKNALKKTLENYARYRSSPKTGVVVMEYIPKRIIYCYDCKKNFYYKGLDTYEYILRELRNHFILNDLPTIYFCNVGTILRQSLLENNQFISTEVFVLLDDDFTEGDMVQTIPANTYLCIYCDNFYKELEYAEKLLKYAREHGYIINGDYLCEVIADLPVLENGERNMFFKLQIPIKFDLKND